MNRFDRRFTQETGQAVFIGSELLVKGALETTGGVHLFTGTPGVPLRGYFNALKGIAPLLAERGQTAELGHTEAATIAMLCGAQLPGCRAVAAMRSVGLASCVEALTHSMLGGTSPTSGSGGSSGGGVIICADEPWHDTQAAPFDARFLAEHLRMGLLEPSCPQEIKDWIDLAMRLSQVARMAVGYRLTSAQAEGGGTVHCHANQYPLDGEPRRSLGAHRAARPTPAATPLEQRLADLVDEARRLNVNRIMNRPHKDEVVPLGFIAGGTAYAFLSQALAQIGLAGRIPTLKLGLTFPVDARIVTDLARQCERLIVIEEHGGFVERQVVRILSPLRQRGEAVAEVFGQALPGEQSDRAGMPGDREPHPSRLIERLAPVLRNHPAVWPLAMGGADHGLAAAMGDIERTARYDVRIGERTPTFCAGCPHRDSSSVLLELKRDLFDPQYMLEFHKRKPVELICHADAGCSSLLMREPNRELMAEPNGVPVRGLGAATARGAEPFIENKQLVFMGDGTFFQSGQAAIAESIHSGQDVTYVILDNKTMALTGRHLHADDPRDVMGRPTFAQRIGPMIEGMIPRKLKRDVRVVSINPADRWRYRNLLEQSILADGVKIIVADKECGITYHRRADERRRRERAEFGFVAKRRHMNIATEVCDNCRECTRLTGCTGLTLVDTDHGPKVQTDLSACVNDRACERIGACPSFEQVTIIRRQPPRECDVDPDTIDLPAPPRPVHADSDKWRCLLAGVGGMGVTAATAILTAAGREMGYHVQFIRHNGVAVRNDGVFIQLLYTRDDAHAASGNGNGKPTAAIPYGGGDLLIGVDLLEAVRAIDPNHRYRIASPDRTAAVVNTAVTPTVRELLGVDDVDAPQLDATLRRYTRREHYFGYDVAELSQRLFGSRQYANIVLLGAAYQKGLLPLQAEALHRAIKAVLPDEADRNLAAFTVGRQIVANPSLYALPGEHRRERIGRTYADRVAALRRQRGERTTRRFRRLVLDTRQQLGGAAHDPTIVRALVVAMYDCVAWGGIPYAKRYAQRIAAIARRDEAQHGYQLTHAAIINLGRVMVIKDEVYVSQLLTSDEKYERDRRRFNIDPSRGDQIIYRHYHRPEFEIFGRRIRFEWGSRDWQLRIMARLGVLRKLMPGWHKREYRYRDFFERIVDQVDYQPGRSPREYQRWLAIVRTPETVTGFRDVWYPRMVDARRKAERLLATDPQRFEPPAPPVPIKRVSLPVVMTG
jgi:indolepyruvate ferredoxin oxidoreductase